VAQTTPSGNVALHPAHSQRVQTVDGGRSLKDGKTWANQKLIDNLKTTPPDTEAIFKPS
jgi:hypothetical protein